MREKDHGPDIVLKKGNRPWSIEFGDSNPFSQQEGHYYQIFSTEGPNRLCRNQAWEPKPRLVISASKHAIDFYEVFAPIRNGEADMQKTVAARVHLAASKFTMIEFIEDPLTDSLVMLLAVDDGKSCVELDYKQGAPENRNLQDLLLGLTKLRSNMGGQIRFIRLKFGNISKHRGFGVDKLREIMGGDLKKSAITIGEHFCATQKRSLNAEDAAHLAQLDALKRTNCIVRTTLQSRPSGMGIVFDITSPFYKDQWQIENGSKIMLFDPFTFKEEAPAKDGDGKKGWTALVKEHTATGIIAAGLNLMSDDEKQTYDGQTVKGVTISVIDEDHMKDALWHSLQVAATAFRCELGLLEAEDPSDEPAAHLRVPHSHLFIQHEDVNLSNWSGPPISLNNPGPIAYQEDWRLEDSHKTVFNTILAGRGGITGIRGPPGTGKSTLIAKCVAMILTQCKVKGGIVLCAHSNQAAHVLLEKCFSVFSTFGLDASKEVVLVESSAGVQRRKESYRTLPVGLEASSLEHQLLILAESDPTTFEPYLKYIGRISRGEPLRKDQRTEFKDSEALLKQTLREQKRVFVCTVAVTGSKFFTNTVPGNKPFDCEVLFVDEASQCPMPYFLYAWQKQNPGHLVIGGDYAQLQAFTRTAEANAIWKYSPVWYVEKYCESVCVLLDVQFRMPKHVYEPTNVVHYAGRIGTPASLQGRAYESDLLKILLTIEVDTVGNGQVWRRLNHNVTIFDLQDGSQSTYGAHSSCNEREALVVERFLFTLHKAGVPWEDIMALTPYEGQYQLLMKWRKTQDAPNLAVRKIDSSQGAEKPIVVFSSVKTGELGFMSSTQRMNVATSRQRSAFFMFGALKTLLEDKTWSLWYKTVRSANDNLGTCYLQVHNGCQFRVRSSAEGSTSAGQPQPQPRPRPQPQASPAQDVRLSDSKHAPSTAGSTSVTQSSRPPRALVERIVSKHAPSKAELAKEASRKQASKKTNAGKSVAPVGPPNRTARQAQQGPVPQPTAQATRAIGAWQASAADLMGERPHAPTERNLAFRAAPPPPPPPPPSSQPPVRMPTGQVTAAVSAVSSGKAELQAQQTAQVRPTAPAVPILPVSVNTPAPTIPAARSRYTSTFNWADSVADDLSRQEPVTVARREETAAVPQAPLPAGEDLRVTAVITLSRALAGPVSGHVSAIIAAMPYLSHEEIEAMTKAAKK